MCPICVSIEPCERHFPYLLYSANVDCESFQEPKATQPTSFAGTANLHPEPPPKVKTKEKAKTMAKGKEKETESKKKRQRRRTGQNTNPVKKDLREATRDWW